MLGRWCVLQWKPSKCLHNIVHIYSYSYVATVFVCVCVCVVCMCIVYTTTLLSDVERRSAFRRTLYTVSMCVSEVCSYSMCILHTYIYTYYKSLTLFFCQTLTVSVCCLCFYCFTMRYTHEPRSAYASSVH